MTGVQGPPPDPRDLLRKYDLQPKRGFSQNFLVQANVSGRIADAAVVLGRTVVEVGPGLGSLTHALLDRGCQVTAVELDRDMVRVLEAEYGNSPGLEVVQGDAAELDLRAKAAAHGRLVVVGNLPYQSTGAIIRRVIDHADAIAGAVLMVQKEVRDRLVSRPGTAEYGALTVFAQSVFGINTVLRLRPGSFYPPPKVESAVVRLLPLEVPRAAETEAFRAVVRAAFQSRRKTLRNALRNLGDAARADSALAASEIDPRRRGETLSIEEFEQLASAWGNSE